MQTATNPQTGEKLVLQNGQWMPMNSQAAPAMPQGVQIVGTPRQKPVDPMEAARLDLSRQSQALSQQNAGNQQSNSRFDNISNLRKEFNALPEVKNYSDTAQALGSMWTQPNNAQGDLAIVYGFAKVMDPGSVVREGEMDMANSTSSLVQDVYRKYGQISEGNRLPPEVRKQLIQSAMSKGAALNDSYNQQRQRYQQLAEQNGIDVSQIVGDHLGDAQRGAADKFNSGNMLSNADLDAQLKQRIASGEDPARIILWLQEQKQPLTEETINAIMANRGNQNPDVSRKSDTQRSLEAGVGDLVEGVGDVAGLVANPLNAGINWATGSNLTTDLGGTLREAAGLPEGNPYAGAVNQGGIAALTGAGAARAAAPLVSGVARAGAESLAAEPIRQGLSGSAAGLGTETAKQNNLGPVGQLAAGVASGMGAYGGANALLKTVGGSAPSEIAQIAARQKVDLMPQDVGGVNARRVTASAAQTPLSAEPVVKAATRTQDQLKDATGRAAGQAGNVMQPDDAGDHLRAPLKDFGQRQGARIGRVYERAEARAEGVKIVPKEGLAFIDGQIARFKAAGKIGDPLVDDLQKLRDSIANGVSVSGMRDARTILSQGVFDGKLRSGMQKGIYKEFLGLLSKDIENGLTAAGRKDALNLFKIADKAWSERIDYIDDVLEPVIGNNKSGEDVLRAVEGMAQGRGGGVRRLSELLRELPQEQQGNVRATIIDRLGTATPGQQNAEGTAFSSNTFLTNWNRLSAKGKAALFSDGELRRNLNDIAKLSEAVKESSKYANSSNTSGGVLGNVGVLASIGLSHPKTALTIGAIQHATGKLMASKAFTSWLARVPNNPALLQRHEGQLAQIAAREPIIANDIQSVLQYLNSQSYRAAAGTQGQAEDRR